MRVRPLLVPALAVVPVAAALVVPGVAMADHPALTPDSKIAIANCSDGNTYVATTEGEFAPARVIGANRTLYPTAFGPEHVVLFNSAGAVVADFRPEAKTNPDPVTAKGYPTSCSFTLTYSFDDPSLGRVSAYVTGTVDAIVAQEH